MNDSTDLVSNKTKTEDISWFVFLTFSSIENTMKQSFPIKIACFFFNYVVLYFRSFVENLGQKLRCFGSLKF